jgi:hypothetical protein
VSDDERLVALSLQLVRSHQILRAHVASLRRAYAGQPSGEPNAAGVDLPSYCIGFCCALQAHHRGEDEQVFPALRRQRPDLAPVLDQLIEDHRLIAGVLLRL